MSFCNKHSCERSRGVSGDVAADTPIFYSYQRTSQSRLLSKCTRFLMWDKMNHSDINKGEKTFSFPARLLRSMTHSNPPTTATHSWWQ